jgi:glycosyltransferase involved in cell wall biosynthesis
MARIAVVWSHSMASQGMEDDDWLSKEDSLMYSLTKLAGDGHEVSVHALTEEAGKKDLEREGYRITLHPVDVRGRSYGEQTSRSLYESLRLNPPEIVYLNSLNLSMNWILAHRIKGPRFALRVHGKLIHDFLVEEVDALEVSNELQRMAATGAFTIPQESVWINPFGADTSLFRPDWDAQKEFDVVYAGRLVKGKNVDLLLRLFKKVDGKLLLIGKGRDEEFYRSRANRLGIDHKVTFEGWVPNSELPRYLNMSKLFVMPSFSEGGGRSVAEAMACGLPVIAMKGSIGSEAYIEHGRVGYIVPPDALVNTVRSFLQDEEKTRAFGERGRRLAEAKYSSDSFYGRLSNLISSLEKSRPRKGRPYRGFAFRMGRVFRFNFWLAVKNSMKCGRIERAFRPEDNWV